MTDQVTLPIKRLDKTLDMPAYAYPGDAGLDLRAAESAVLKPFERKLVSCGIAIAIPRGYAGFVLPRSGLAAKHGISIVNAPGLIDSDYRGEIKAILVNLDPSTDFEIEHGDRIAQLVIMPVPTVTLEEADELSETQRGAGGFGSSGVSA
ncbi:MAG: dUTP diphosphatase [Eggerthellaceae bacterium]|nr:dUTP diphosphatase [Eggerthellaceae bacterium]